jgi:hypothetical protein
MAATIRVRILGITIPAIIQARILGITIPVIIPAGTTIITITMSTTNTTIIDRIRKRSELAGL